MSTRRVATSLARWSFAFAWVHVAWALGWRAGVPDGSPAITDRPGFLVYDLLAGAAMFAAAGVAWWLGHERGSPGIRRVLVAATLAGASLALARGVPALTWDVVTAAPWGLGWLADVWFTVAGGLGLLLWRRARQEDRIADTRAQVAVAGRVAARTR